MVAQISAVLASETGVELPEGEIAPLPFDAASDVPIDDQRWVMLGAVRRERESYGGERIKSAINFYRYKS